jgi:hypothetical protein
MSSQSFAELLGNILHDFGVVEFQTNLLIQALGKDSILSDEIVKLNLGRRIKILRRLLHERTQAPEGEIDSVCDDFAKLATERNAIAHNPVATDMDGSNPHIIDVRQISDLAKGKELSEKDLQDLRERTGKALRTLSDLMLKAHKPAESSAGQGKA